MARHILYDFVMLQMKDGERVTTVAISLIMAPKLYSCKRGSEMAILMALQPKTACEIFVRNHLMTISQCVCCYNLRLLSRQ